MTALLETRALTMRFGGVVAVDRVDFSLREGELRCLIGRNGAGKSTFFKCLTGQLRPTARRHDPVADPGEQGDGDAADTAGGTGNPDLAALRPRSCRPSYAPCCCFPTRGSSISSVEISHAVLIGRCASERC